MNEEQEPGRPSHSIPLVSVKPTCVIFDLDGTLIDTETIVLDVSQSVLKKYDKVLTKDVIAASVGKRPLDAWQQVIDMIYIPATAEELFNETESILTERCALNLLHKTYYDDGTDAMIYVDVCTFKGYTVFVFVHS